MLESSVVFSNIFRIKLRSKESETPARIENMPNILYIEQEYFICPIAEEETISRMFYLSLFFNLINLDQ